MSLTLTILGAIMVVLVYIAVSYSMFKTALEDIAMRKYINGKILVISHIITISLFVYILVVYGIGYAIFYIAIDSIVESIIIVTYCLEKANNDVYRWYDNLFGNSIGMIVLVILPLAVILILLTVAEAFELMYNSMKKG